MKITEKAQFNIVREASYVYILSGQNFIKMQKVVNFGEFLKPEAVLQDMSLLMKQKVMENAISEQSKMRHFK